MPIRILVVDDDPDIRDVLKLTLSEENYEIIEAKDGEEALKLIAAEPLDLVLLDYRIPKVDGREVCRRTKKDLLLRHLPIIMVTGKGDVSDKVGGIDAGADDFFLKPFPAKKILLHLRKGLKQRENLLQKRRLADELKRTSPTIKYPG